MGDDAKLALAVFAGIIALVLVIGGLIVISSVHTTNAISDCIQQWGPSECHAAFNGKTQAQ